MTKFISIDFCNLSDFSIRATNVLKDFNVSCTQDIIDNLTNIMLHRGAGKYVRKEIMQFLKENCEVEQVNLFQKWDEHQTTESDYKLVIKDNRSPFSTSVYPTYYHSVKEDDIIHRLLISGQTYTICEYTHTMGSDKTWIDYNDYKGELISLQMGENDSQLNAFENQSNEQ